MNFFKGVVIVIIFLALFGLLVTILELSLNPPSVTKVILYTKRLNCDMSPDTVLETVPNCELSSCQYRTDPLSKVVYFKPAEECHNPDIEYFQYQYLCDHNATATQINFYKGAFHNSRDYVKIKQDTLAQLDCTSSIQW